MNLTQPEILTRVDAGEDLPRSEVIAQAVSRARARLAAQEVPTARPSHTDFPGHCTCS